MPPSSPDAREGQPLGGALLCIRLSAAARKFVAADRGWFSSCASPAAIAATALNRPARARSSCSVRSRPSAAVRSVMSRATQTTPAISPSVSCQGDLLTW